MAELAHFPVESVRILAAQREFSLFPQLSALRMLINGESSEFINTLTLGYDKCSASEGWGFSKMSWYISTDFIVEGRDTIGWFMAQDRNYGSIMHIGIHVPYHDMDQEENHKL